MGGGRGPGRGGSPQGTPPQLSLPPAPLLLERRGAPWFLALGRGGLGMAGDGFPSSEELEKQVVHGWVGRGGERALSTEHSLHSVWGWGLRTAHSLHPSGMVPGTGCQALRLRSWVPRCLSPPPAPAAAAPDLSWHVPAQPASPAPPAHSLCRGSRRGAELGWHRPGASSLDARAGLGATMVYRGWQPPAQGLVIAPHPPPSRRHLRIPGLLTA